MRIWLKSIKVPACFSLLVFCVMTSCSSKQEPSYQILPKQKMIDIVSDLHVAEAALSAYTLKQRDSVSSEFLGEILRIHQVEKSDFDREMEILNVQPDSLESLLREVVAQLREMELSKQLPALN